MAEGGSSQTGANVVDWDTHRLTSTRQNIAEKSKEKFSKKEIESNNAKLKKIVVHILKNNPKGVKLSKIWNLVKTESKQNFSAANCGVSKLSHVLQNWSDSIAVTWSEKDPIITLRHGAGVRNNPVRGISPEVMLNENNFPLLSRESQSQKSKAKVEAVTHSKDASFYKSSEGHNDNDDVKGMIGKSQSLQCAEGEILYQRADGSHADKTNPSNRVIKTAKRKSKKSTETPGTVEKNLQLDSKPESVIKSANRKSSKIVEKDSESSIDKHVSGAEKVSDSKEIDNLVTTPTQQVGLFGLQWAPVTQLKLPVLNNPKLPPEIRDPAIITEKYELPTHSIDHIAPQSRQRNQNKRMELNYTSFLGGLQSQDNQIPIVGVGDSGCQSTKSDNSKPVKVKPIDRDEFEIKKIDIRPVYVAKGRKPSKEQINNVAQECIEILSDADLFVTQERVEKLICQRFSCQRLQELGIRYIDQIECVNELNRLICKINVYINAFIKTRAICTLHELKNELKEYATDDGDFSSLKTGPLQRFPVVFQQFQFPPDQLEIPEITTMDILDHFRTYLDRKGLWRTKMELKPFMDYLVEQYDADNAFMLGVRIRSLPLALTTLKKAQRDSANSRREIKDHFEEELRNEIGEAFRKFRTSIMQTGESEGMEIRKHYLKMKPELAIMEVFDKFNILIMVTQAGDVVLKKAAKFRKAIEDFLTVMRDNELGRNLFHLALCMSNTAVEEMVKDMFSPIKNDDAEDNKENFQPQQQLPPTKDELAVKLRTYIGRCLNTGALSLVHLDRIEEKLLEDFNFSAFSKMGYGRFLEFMLSEAKQMLEEGGGLSLGSSSAGSADSDTAFRPSQTDLIEFIKQFKQHADIQPEQIEEALCRQYNVSDVRHLGHGNISRLLGYTGKAGRHIYDDFTVFYESAFLRSVRMSSTSNSKVGILGHQSRDAAKFCLHSCPLLENLADWSQWSLVFEPEHGKLKDFVQKYGGVSTKPFEDGRLITLDFLALEIKPGVLIKTVSTTSPDDVAEALTNHNVVSTAGHLVSMVIAYKGVESMPIALLAGHMKTVLLQMHAVEPSDNSNENDHADKDSAAMFVLKCLLHIPTNFCVAFANQLFLDPLAQVVGSSKSKQLLIQLCSSNDELNKVIKLGCLLGIQEWTNVIYDKCQPPVSNIQISTEEAEDFIENDTEVQENEEIIEEFETEDVDEILTGGDNEDGKINVVEVKHSDKGDKNDIEGKDETEVLETEDTADIEDVEMVKEKGVELTCEDIVNQIRREEFGVGIHLNADGERLMKVQQERLGRSLDRLSKDLYSKDTHFVLELVQNADDNSYPDNLLSNSKDGCPSVKFVIEHDGIYVFNNELGFREKDIKALCDVGRSTKGKHKYGYIGQKGIGFKSVFRISDTPEVHSNGYHIQFDVNSGPMGYILPHWVHEEKRISQEGWMTQIILKLKPEMRLQTRTLAARFNDLHPSLLLFLHRLRQITIDNKVENSVQTMKRRDIGDNVIVIEHSGGCDRWLVIKKILDASNISLQTKSGAEVESTEIALAFPLKHQCKKNSVQMMPPKQPVFAFLPLRSYGFRFIIQGDFDVPSSREDVDRDSSWNQWLRNEIPNVFLDTLDVFKTHSEFSSMEAVCTFLQFVPMEDEVLEFFKPVASDILKKLKAKPCIPTLEDKQGTISWKIPSQTVKVRDPLVRSVITPDLLETHLNLFYLHPDIATVLNQSLTSCLGIENLTSDHLFQLGKALIVNMGTQCNKDEDVILISKWMACLYRSLDEFHHDDTILQTLKAHRFLPLSNGELVSLLEKTVFYPIPNLSSKKQKGKDPMYYLQQDLSSLHPLLLDTGDAEVNSQVHKLLLRLGVKQLSPSDVINHHIIPVLKSDKWQKKEKGTLVAYMIYIKEQSDKQASVCNLDELKNIAVVLTNCGFKQPSQEPVQFPTQYGNPINLQEVFIGYDWTLLDTCYLPKTCTRPIVLSWQEFFKKLGVEDFLSVRKKDVYIKRDELEQTYWSLSSSVWPRDEDVYIVQDYFSVELEGLIRNNKYPSGQHFEKQMQNLCELLDRHWDTHFSKYCKTYVLDKDGKFLKETDTSLSILLQTSEWLPAEKTEIIELGGQLKPEVKIVMKEPKCLYLPSNKIQSLLSDKVLYIAVNVTAGTFCQFLGLKNSVTLKTVKSYLLQWCKREKENLSASFYTSLDHMKNVYTYLGEELKKQELQDLLRDNPVYFVPVNPTGYNSDEVVKGKMLSRNEIWLMDRTGLFEKHREILEEFHSDIALKRTIKCFYGDRQNIIDIFKQEGKIDTQPRSEEFIELLCLLCNTSSPRDIKVLLDVLTIFSTIGQALCTYAEGMPDEKTAIMALDALGKTVRKKLYREKVFPTTKLIWVSVEQHPLIPDNREWEKMFAEKEGVHFLDMEDKSNKASHVVRSGVGHKRQRNKILDSGVNQDMIKKVIEICGIRNLSESVEIRPVPGLIEPCLELQAYFCKIVPSIQKFLIAGYEDVYHQLEIMKTKKMLADSKFYKTNKLEVSYWLNNNLPEDTFIIKDEKCVIHPPEFYFHHNHLNAFAEINREIARYFSRGHTDCIRSLRSFLSELSSVVSGDTDDDVDELLQRYEADGIEINEEELWIVEAPVFPDPAATDELEEEGLSEEEEDEVKVVVGSQDGEFELRMWPLVASENKIHVAEGAEKQKSNIWPPPQAKDYMKSVKDLPANIKMIVHKQTEGEEGSLSQLDNQTESSAIGQELKTYPVHLSDFERATGLVEDCKAQGAVGQLRHIAAEKLGENTGVQQLHKTPDTDISAAVKIDNNLETDEKEGIKIKDIDLKGHDTSDKNNSALDDQGQATVGRKSGGSSVHRKRKGQHPFNRGQPIIKGDPVWTFMATEYLYEDLGTGKDLGNIDSLSLCDDAAGPEIGEWGEALVAQYLERQKELGKILDYSWKNSEEETGCPFDFEIQLAGNTGVLNNYIEVKSTLSEDKEVFDISMRQIQFAEQEKEKFHIYRVFNAGNPELVKLIRITNLNMRLAKKQVKLCMLI